MSEQSCAFCDKKKSEAAQLVARNDADEGMMICDECVSLCVTMMLRARRMSQRGIRRLREELEAARELVRAACVVPGEEDFVRYGEYTSDSPGVYVFPKELPNIPCLEKDIAELKEENEGLREEVARYEAEARAHGMQDGG